MSWLAQVFFFVRRINIRIHEKISLDILKSSTPLPTVAYLCAPPRRRRFFRWAHARTSPSSSGGGNTSRDKKLALLSLLVRPPLPHNGWGYSSAPPSSRGSGSNGKCPLFMWKEGQGCRCLLYCIPLYIIIAIHRQSP